MRIPILAAREGWHTDELRRALTAQGHETAVFPYEALIAHVGTAPASTTPAETATSGTMSPAGLSSHSHLLSPPATLDAQGANLLDADAVLPRIIPNGSLEQIIYRVDALHWLEESGVRVMNPAGAIERTVDKFFTSALLERVGLRVPETVVCERASDAITAFRNMGDVIVKPLFGSMGLGMIRVSDEEVAWRVFRALEAIRGVYYLQRAIAHDGRDVRAFVVGDRVIGAIERYAPAHEWRTNIARGGRAEAIDIPAQWQDMALCATRAVGAEYAGVDILPARDGAVYVLEVNGIPGWRGLQEATSLDVAGAIISHLLRTGPSIAPPPQPPPAALPSLNS